MHDLVRQRSALTSSSHMESTWELGELREWKIISKLFLLPRDHGLYGVREPTSVLISIRSTEPTSSFLGNSFHRIPLKDDLPVGIRTNLCVRFSCFLLARITCRILSRQLEQYSRFTGKAVRTAVRTTLGLCLRSMHTGLFPGVYQPVP